MERGSTSAAEHAYGDDDKSIGDGARGLASAEGDGATTGNGNLGGTTGEGSAGDTAEDSNGETAEDSNVRSSTEPTGSPMPHLDTPSSMTRSERREARRLERERRHRVGEEVAGEFGGVAQLAHLMSAGLTRDQIRAEIEAGAWVKVGVRTIHVSGGDPAREARWWRALWESGSRAVLDGESALLAAGLTGWDSNQVDVSLPNNARPRPISGVRHHYLREVGPTITSGVPRTRPEIAVIRAAQWAVSDRQAATLIAMTVQQGLVKPSVLIATWEQVRQSPRRDFLATVIVDVCDGARALSELDFAQACRRRGLPEPTRQAMRRGRSGSVFLDVLWEDIGLHIEIHGAHHANKLAPVEDSLRSNHVQLQGDAQITLQIPLLGLRLREEEFLDQVEQAITTLRQRQGEDRSE